MSVILALLAGSGAKLAAFLAAVGTTVVVALRVLGNARRAGAREQLDKARQQKEMADAAASKALDDVAALDDRAVVSRLHTEYDTHT